MAEIILPPEEETPQTPELNIDKPTENSKVITIEFEAKKTNKVSTKDTNQQLYTTDTDAWFEFKETSLESANGTYSVVFRNRHDGSIFQRTGDVVNGVAYYKIPHQEIRHAGAWRGQIVYTLSNGDTTAREFDYDVKGHILDGKDVREIVVEDFETLMSQLRSMKDNAELELAGLVNTANQNETDRQVFFDDLVEDIDELQANYQELLDTGVLQTNINTKLEALEEEYAPRLTEVTAQLAQTAKKSEVRENTYNRPINVDEMDTETKALFTGGAVAVVGENAVGNENIKEKAVRESNTTFFEISDKNILNPYKVQKGIQINPDTGSVNTSSTYKDFQTTDYMAVTQGKYVINKRVNWAVFYDADKVFLGGYYTPGYSPRLIFEGEPFDTPENTAFMRVTMSITVDEKTTQIEKNNVVTTFEPHFVPQTYAKDGSIELKKLAEPVTTKSEFNNFKNNIVIGGGSNKDSNIIIPSNFSKWKVLDSSSDVSKWNYDTSLSTALGTVSAVSEIDTSKLPANYFLNERMKKPWIFQKDRPMSDLGDLLGNKMMMFEVEPGGTAYFHRPLDEVEDFSQSGEIAIAFWVDSVSNDTTKEKTILPTVYTDYDNDLSKHRHVVDERNLDALGEWSVVTSVSVRKTSNPAIWKDNVLGGTALETVGGIGFKVINNSPDKKARFYVSGIFRIENTLERGKLIIDFDDAFLSQYQEAFRYMYDTYGYKGNISVVGKWIELGYIESMPDYPTMSKEQMLEVQNAGWDITSHTWNHDILGFSGYGTERVRANIQKNYQWLSENGVGKGKRFLIYPEGSYDRRTADIAKQFHVMSRGGSVYMQVSPTVRQWHYPGLDFAGRPETSWRQTLQMLQDHKGVAVRLFHHIGEQIGELGYNPISVAKFRQFIDIIQEYDVDVITWSEFYDNYVSVDSL